MDRYLSLTGLTAPECVALAPVAEAAGFAGVALSDHLVLPDDLGTYPNAPDGKVPFTHSTPWPDVWVAIGAMAAVTTTLRFRTTVLLLPLRHPIVVARAVGTAACLAPGRVEVGVGLGWLAGEYEVVGVDFARRGRLLEESIAALRALWGPGPAHHAGEEWSFGPVHLEPTPPVVPPILIGAGAPRALRRAATLGDGYIVPGVPFDRSIELIGEVRALRERLGPGGRPFHVQGRVTDPDSADQRDRAAAAGVDSVVVTAWTPADDTLAAKAAAVERAATRWSA